MEQVLDITSPAEIDDPLLFIRHGVTLPQSEGTQKGKSDSQTSLILYGNGAPNHPCVFSPRIPLAVSWRLPGHSFDGHVCHECQGPRQ